VPSHKRDRVLFVFAYPGDETKYAGGTIADMVANRVAVSVVTVTRGEGLPLVSGAPIDSTDGVQVASLRSNELHDALMVLGVTDHRYLGSSVARASGRNPRPYTSALNAIQNVDPMSRLLVDASVVEVAEDLKVVVEMMNPDAIVSYGSGELTHEQQIVREAVASVALSEKINLFGIWEGQDANDQVDVSKYLPKKIKAMEKFRSLWVVNEGKTWHSPVSGGDISSVETFNYIRPRRIHDDSNITTPRNAIFAFIAVLFAFAWGAVVGVVSTLAHNAVVRGIPIGIIAGIAAISTLVVGLRIVGGTRWFAGAASLGFMGALFWVIYLLPNSSIMANNVLGNIWNVIPLVVILLTLTFPSSDTLERLRIQRQAAKSLQQ